jgi:hypothetical protein
MKIAQILGTVSFKLTGYGTNATRRRRMAFPQISKYIHIQNNSNIKKKKNMTSFRLYYLPIISQRFRYWDKTYENYNIFSQQIKA